jgi:hypothetical protein
VSRKTVLLLFALLLAGGALLYFLSLRSAPPRPRPRIPSTPRSAATAPLKIAASTATPPPPEKVRVTLFFVSPKDGLLRPEERDIPKPADAVAFGRALVSEELAGPKTSGLLPALPDKVSLRNLFVPGGGLVVVDLNVDAAWARSAGSEEELEAVGAIVDALLQNLAQSDRVRILVNGGPVETLAGHVDLTRPLPVLRDIVGAPALDAAPARP